MRLKYIIVFFFLSFYFTHASPSRNIPKNIPELVKKQTIGKQKDSIYIVVNECASTQKNERWFEKYLSPLIALFTVIISSFVAYNIGIAQIKNQKELGKHQLESHEAESLEQNTLLRQQISTSFSTALSQVRTNNISQARIAWIQDLRNLLTELMGNISITNYYLEEVVTLHAQGDKAKAKQAYLDQISSINTVESQIIKVKLFLNPKEPNHKLLEELLNKYAKNALADISTIRNDFEQETLEIINASREILKQAWNDAKREVK